MLLQYFKANGFHRGSFKMTSKPIKMTHRIKKSHFWHTFYFRSHVFPFCLIDLISNFPGKGVPCTPGNSVKYSLGNNRTYWCLWVWLRSPLFRWDLPCFNQSQASISRSHPKTGLLFSDPYMYPTLYHPKTGLLFSDPYVPDLIPSQIRTPFLRSAFKVQYI